MAGLRLVLRDKAHVGMASDVLRQQTLAGLGATQLFRVGVHVWLLDLLQVQQVHDLARRCRLLQCVRLSEPTLRGDAQLVAKDMHLHLVLGGNGLVRNQI